MPHRLARRAALGALALAAACEVPTGIPHWQESWNLPAKTTAISVASLLPSGVAIAPDSSAFLVDVAPVTVSRQLSQDCAACAAANGTTVPKPAFTMSSSTSTPLPAAIASAVLVGDTLTLAVANGLSFDPLRPAAAARGHLLLTITNGATTLARDSVDGATTAMPPGTTLVRHIALVGTVSGSAPVVVAATLESPPGDSVQMNASDSVTITASTGRLHVSTAQVRVQNQSVSAAPVTLDLSGISSSVASRVVSGAIDLGITNPFAVQGTVTLYLTGTSASGQAIDLGKSVALSNAATSTSAVAFSQAEVQQLVGAKLALQVSGSVSGPSGVVTVTPRQTVDVSTRFDIVVNTVSTP